MKPAEEERKLNGVTGRPLLLSLLSVKKLQERLDLKCKKFLHIA